MKKTDNQAIKVHNNRYFVRNKYRMLREHTQALLKVFCRSGLVSGGSSVSAENRERSRIHPGAMCNSLWLERRERKKREEEREVGWWVKGWGWKKWQHQGLEHRLLMHAGLFLWLQPLG